MISPFDYWTKIAKPTADEFIANRDNVRLAMLACMAVLHAVDYALQNSASDAKTANRQISQYMKDAADRSFSFRVIRDFALASKHCHLTSHHPGLQSDQLMVATPAIFGKMVLGRTFLGDTVGGVTVKVGAHQYANLTKSLKSAMSFLEGEFPALLTV